tara:strand:- start:68 stop:820 length:753 start_codon:yes stop_codon:yes gene_type:complete
MKAIIVAAGIGSRLGELTKNMPKSLVDVNGKSILERQISVFRKLGITDITVIIGPHSEKYKIKNISIIKDIEFMSHDILSSLMIAKPIMDDELIVCYGDIIFDEQILRPIIDFNQDIGLGIDFDWEKNYSENDDQSKQHASTVEIKNGLILKIKGNSISNEYKNKKLGEFTGIIKLSKIGSEILIKNYDELLINHEGQFHESPSFSQAYFTDMFQELIDSGVNIHPITVNGVWCEIDTEKDLNTAKKLFP